MIYNCLKFRIRDSKVKINVLNHVKFFGHLGVEGQCLIAVVMFLIPSWRVSLFHVNKKQRLVHLLTVLYGIKRDIIVKVKS